MKIQYTPKAIERWTASLVYLTERNPTAALRLFNKVQASLLRLSTFPMRGSVVREYRHLPIREVIVEPYRFFYQIDRRRKTVWIVDVWHGAQWPSTPELPAPPDRF